MEKKREKEMEREDRREEKKKRKKEKRDGGPWTQPTTREKKGKAHGHTTKFKHQFYFIRRGV